MSTRYPVAASRFLASSTRAWRQERSSDHWANLASMKDLRSRAAFKLEELNARFGKFMRPGVNVVDLGASPGGFSMVASRHLRPWTRFILGGESSCYQCTSEETYAWTADMEEVPGARFVRGNVFQEETRNAVIRALKGEEADVILSDMAPKTGTDPKVAHFQSVELARSALETADKLLRSGGTFVVKIFAGEDEKKLRKQLKERFVKVKAFKPKASKKQSVEHYLVGQGFVQPEMRIANNENDEGPFSLICEGEGITNPTNTEVVLAEDDGYQL